jgi:hypothetical protein
MQPEGFFDASVEVGQFLGFSKGNQPVCFIDKVTHLRGSVKFLEKLCMTPWVFQ